jgi:acetyl esterase/lipase
MLPWRPTWQDGRCRRRSGERLRLPESAPDKAVCFLHGGGYTSGSVNTHRDLVSRIARAAGATALSIDYRLAPENKFPAALEDAVKAYRWLIRRVDPANIAIAGDSAGGGLAVAALVALRDAGEPLPAAAALMSPWVDLALTGESMASLADDDPMNNREEIERMADAYLQGADPKTPLASPVYADLTGLPPLLVQAGSAEVLLDDSVRLAERALAAGVDVTLDIWEEMIHVWQIFAPMLPEGRQAIEQIGAFIRKHIPRHGERWLSDPTDAEDELRGIFIKPLRLRTITAQALEGRRHTRAYTSRQRQRSRPSSTAR